MRLPEPPDLPPVAPRWPYLDLHTSEPARGREETKVEGGHYARVSTHSPGTWPDAVVRHRAVFTAPTGGDRVTHAAFTLPDGRTQWLDLTTDPPTPCDPPPGWVDLDPDDDDRGEVIEGR